MSRPIAFTDARIVDPAASHDGPGTLLVADGVIRARLAPADPIPADAEVRPCDGLAIVPGLVDTRVFVGEPGAEHRESIATAGQAALAGGVTTLLTMPDAGAVVDDPALVSFMRETADIADLADIRPCGALTKGLDGREMAELYLMREAGAVAVSQGRRPLPDAALLRRAMLYARDLDLVIDLAPSEATLARGVVSSGAMGSWLGLAGSSNEAETTAALRDLELARGTRAKLNVACASLPRTIDLADRARDDGADATVSVSINHLALNENDVGDYRTYFRLDPPLRTADDREGLVEALAVGRIDMVCSAHDPQDADTKRLPFENAAPGAIGLETLLPALLRLHHGGHVPLIRLIESVTAAPARRFGLPAGTLAPGAPADLAVVDLDEPWIVREGEIVSRARNTTFENARMQGRVRETWVRGVRKFALPAQDGP